MAKFIYEKPFQIEKDETEYRLLTKDYVKTTEAGGMKILQLDPRGLEVLAAAAISDLSFFLRTSHTRKLRDIIDDPETSDNDRFVAYTMLRNSVISAKEELPWCQDTGTAIVIAKKGEQVWTAADDAMHLSKGIFKAYQEKNLRYSQIVPYTMFEEKNSCTNLPAQIDICSVEGNEYEFLFITKGGDRRIKPFCTRKANHCLMMSPSQGLSEKKYRTWALQPVRHIILPW